jgi:hypothetical protein
MTRRVLAIVASVRRRQNTESGNPRWVVELDDGREFNTADDVADAHAVSEWHAGVVVELEIEAGQIVKYRRVDDSEEEYR